MKKIFKMLFATIVFFFCIGTNVNAVDQTVTHHLRYITSIANPYAGAPAAYFSEETSSGTVTSFCYDRTKVGPPNGSKLTYKGEMTDPGILWILENGQGGTWNTSLLGSGLSTDQKYYATQLAIWLYQGTLDPNIINPNGASGKPALALYRNAKTKRVTQPSISISSGGTMTLTSDGKYYKTNTMTVGGSGYSKYKVTLVNVSADAKIITSNNEVKSSGDSLSAGTKFYVRIPVEKVASSLNMKIKVSASGSIKKAYIYHLANANRQTITFLKREPVTVSAATSATLTPSGSLKIVKVDVSSGTEQKLAGVKLTVKDSSGKVIATWTTTDSNNPYTISNLPLGTYTVIEESAPAGYIKSSNINVTTKAGQTIEVKVTNSKSPSQVKISKQDITTKAELPGATLVLKDSLGKVVDTWVSTTTPHYIKSLTPGKYTLTETIAPEGYLLSTETVTFVVENDGGVTKQVVMYNTPIPDNSLIKISKRDITTEKELPGAKLVVKDANGNIIDEWISTTQPHYLSDLKEGKYKLIETKSPAGYGISDEIVEFEVTADGGVEKTVIMYNSPIPVTADMNLTLIVAGLIGTVGLAGFSIFKLNQQQA